MSSISNSQSNFKVFYKYSACIEVDSLDFNIIYDPLSCVDPYYGTYPLFFIHIHNSDGSSLGCFHSLPHNVRQKCELNWNLSQIIETFNLSGLQLHQINPSYRKRLFAFVLQDSYSRSIISTLPLWIPPKGCRVLILPIDYNLPRFVGLSFPSPPGVYSEAHSSTSF